ncbi:MAG: sarcosine oxidase subunit gamma family protein [Hyphomicrobium sp.]|nr:sarcosine oxidase subunit gamma family protein [Hyphomicrobium sp.]
MSDTATKPRLETPLAHLGLAARAEKPDTARGVWANEAIPLSVTVLRGLATDAAFLAPATEALGVELPTAPCTRVSRDGRTVLWISPDEWMIVADREQGSDLRARLAKALAGQRHQIVDNSGGFTLLRLQGRNARDVLAHVTVFDLDRLRGDRVVGTTIGKATAHIFAEPGGYGLIVRRSYAEYIWAFIERAARPYGFGVAPSGGPPVAPAPVT